MGDHSDEMAGESGSGAADLCEDAEVPLASQIARAGVYVAAMLVSLLANSLLICVVRRNRRMRTVTHQLIVNMAVADLLITVLHMPYMLQVQLTGSHRLHLSGTLATVVCKVAGFSQDLSIACSVLSLVAIALDRFFAILYPLKKVAAFSTAGPLVAAVWLVSLAVCAPLLYANKTERSDGELYCVEDWAPAFDDVTAPRDYTVAVFVLLYACPLVVVTALYSRVACHLWRRKIPTARATREQSAAAHISRVRLVRLLVAVVGLFAFSWITHHVVFFLQNSNDASACPPPSWLVFIGRFLGHVHSAINPCMYFVLSKDYRTGLKQVLPVLGRPSGRLRRGECVNTKRLARYELPSCRSNMETVARDTAHAQIVLTGLSLC